MFISTPLLILCYENWTSNKKDGDWSIPIQKVHWFLIISSQGYWLIDLDSNSPLVFKGVVYNEMKGQMVWFMLKSNKESLADDE